MNSKAHLSTDFYLKSKLVDCDTNECPLRSTQIGIDIVQTFISQLGMCISWVLEASLSVEAMLYSTKHGGKNDFAMHSAVANFS